MELRETIARHPKTFVIGAIGALWLVIHQATADLSPAAGGGGGASQVVGETNRYQTALELSKYGYTKDAIQELRSIPQGHPDRQRALEKLKELEGKVRAQEKASAKAPRRVTPPRTTFNALVVPSRLPIIRKADEEWGKDGQVYARPDYDGYLRQVVHWKGIQYRQNEVRGLAPSATGIRRVYLTIAVNNRYSQAEFAFEPRKDVYLQDSSGRKYLADHHEASIADDGSEPWAIQQGEIKVASLMFDIPNAATNFVVVFPKIKTRMYLNRNIPSE